RLDTLHDVPGHDGGRVVVHFVGPDQNPHFPGRLNGVGFLDAFERVGDGLQPVQPLDVVGQAFTAGARPGRRHRVGRGHQHGLHRLRLFVPVVAFHRVDDGFGLAVPPLQLDADLHVDAFSLVVNGYVAVMQTAGPAGHLHVAAQLHGHHGGDV